MVMVAMKDETQESRILNKLSSPRATAGSRAKAKKAARIVAVGGKVEVDGQEVEWTWLT